MKTIRVPINSVYALDQAKTLINQDQVIAVPTDTVYGVMCRYNSTTAISRLYEAKGRPPQKAIPVLLGNMEQLPQIVRFPIDPRASLLMDKFWPGPLTLILDAIDNLPAILTAGQATVAVRIPQHKTLRDLLNIIGPLAVTSANLSGKAETHTADEVEAQLGGRIPLILSNEDVDNQETENHMQGTASTIVDLSTANQTRADHVPPTNTTLNDAYKFLRNGPIHVEVKRVLDEAAMTKDATKARVDPC